MKKIKMFVVVVAVLATFPLWACLLPLFVNFDEVKEKGV